MRVMANKNMGASSKIFRDERINVSVRAWDRRFPRDSAMTKSREISERIGRRKRFGGIEKFARKTQGRTVDQLGRSALKVLLHCRTNAKKNERQCLCPTLPT